MSGWVRGERNRGEARTPERARTQTRTQDKKEQLEYK